MHRAFFVLSVKILCLYFTFKYHDMKKIIFALIVVVASLFVGCSKDDDATPTDNRDQMVGSYSGTYSALLKFSAVPALGLADATDNGTVLAKVEKDANATDAIKFTDLTDINDQLAIKLNGLTVASNGVGFNIPQQVPKTDIIVSGTTSFSLGALKYDAGFVSSTKVLGFTINSIIISNGYKVPAIVTYSVTKI